MRRGSFTHAGALLEYHEEGRGPAFLFQHGLGGDHRQTFSLVPARETHRTITLNCRAHGESELGDPRLLSFDTLAADALALLEELGVKRVVLGGISMGAAVALACAQAAQDRLQVAGLVLIRPAWEEDGMSEPARTGCAAIARLLRDHAPQQAAERFRQSTWLRALAERDPATARALLEYFEAPRVDDLREVYERLPEQAPVLDPAALSPIPTLVIGTAGDGVHPLDLARRIAARLGVQCFEVATKSRESARHQQEVERLVLDFIDATTDRRSPERPPDEAAPGLV